jgi:hypothetical protein
MMPPSSPAPRPSPSGGLRPTLTPAAGGAAQRQSGAGRFKIKSQQIRSLRFQGIAALSIDTRLALRTAATRLAVEFTGTFGTETIERFLHSSYDQLAQQAAVTKFLPLMAERFARHGYAPSPK